MRIILIEVKLYKWNHHRLSSHRRLKFIIGRLAHFFFISFWIYGNWWSSFFLAWSNFMIIEFLFGIECVAFSWFFFSKDLCYRNWMVQPKTIMTIPFGVAKIWNIEQQFYDTFDVVGHNCGIRKQRKKPLALLFCRLEFRALVFGYFFLLFWKFQLRSRLVFQPVTFV